MSTKTESLLSEAIAKLRTVASHRKSSEEKRKAKFSTPDDILPLTGDPGLFHYVQFVALCLQFISLAMSDLIPIFYNLPPKNIYCPSTNTSDDLGVIHNISDYCGCNEPLVFEYEGNQTSIIGEMALVCEKSFLPSLATTLYYLGSAVAGPICGWLSDKYGRRPALLLASLLFTGIQIALVFTNQYILFAVLRFLAGVARVGVFSTNYVLLMEWSPPNRRTVVAAASEFFFPAGVIVLAGSAYFLQKWQYVQIALAVSSSITLLNLWFAPESLQWLLVNDKVAQASVTLRHIAKLNGRELFHEDIRALQLVSNKLIDEEKTTKKYTMWDCFRISHIRKFTLLISFVWFATNFGYSGLSYLIDTLSNNVYKDLAIGGSLELIPCILATLIVIKCGKRFPLIGFLLLGGFLTIAAGIIPPASQLRIVLALLGRMSLVGSYCLMFLYAAELFPTVIRNSGFGVGFFFFMFGGMLSPQLALLNDCYLFRGMPVVIVGGVAVLGAIAAGILPEHADPHVFSDVLHLYDSVES